MAAGLLNADHNKHTYVKNHFSSDDGVSGEGLQGGNSLPPIVRDKLLHLSTLHTNRRDIITCYRWCNSLCAHQLLLLGMTETSSDLENLAHP